MSNAVFTLPYDIVGFKKSKTGKLITLLIEAGTEIVANEAPSSPRNGKWCGFGKMRAAKARVLNIEDHDVEYQSAAAWYENRFEYRVRRTVKPSRFDRSHRVCAPGIHFFTTVKEARQFNPSLPALF